MMRRTAFIAASLLLLTACGGGTPAAVGENSAASIKTTAVGEIVSNLATPTPTPTPTAETVDPASNADVAADAVADAADNSVTSH